MASNQLSKVLQHLRQVMGGGAAVDVTDGQLLRDFVQHQDETAFRALLERYGPMVMGVCRRAQLGAHDADDAFQATFLVLVRKAGAIREQELVGNWLYGVAFRIARRARQQAARRGFQRSEVPDMAIPGLTTATDDQEARLVIDEELQQLPRKYRVPLVLCYLEGKTNEATAKYLRCPPGTLKTRLARGRELLRARLERRGLALSAAGLAALLAPEALQAAVAPTLTEATLEAATLCAAGQAVASAASAPVASLVDGAVRELFVAKLQAVAGAALLLLAVGAGFGFVAYRTLSPVEQPVAAVQTPAGMDDEVLPPLEDNGLAREIEQQVADWQPNREERRFDEIGWSRNLGEARRLAAQHQRPIFLLTFGQSIATGRCPASAANLRAGGLSNDEAINLLNGAFVPVYLSNVDYRPTGAAPAAEKAELERIREEAIELALPNRLNQAWMLSPEGRVLNVLDACHSPPQELLDFLKAFTEGDVAAGAKPLVAPRPQSRPPQVKADALVLHLTARYLERDGDNLIPLRVAWGKQVNYFMKGCPAEDWIVLVAAEQRKLLPSEPVSVGSSWEIDAAVAARLFRHMYPPTEDNDLSRNRIDEGRLTATVALQQDNRLRVRLEGSLLMKHRFDPERDDNRFVKATLRGYFDCRTDRPGIRTLRLASTNATYGKTDLQKDCYDLPLLPPVRSIDPC
ncbi:MAG: sigma-70 family RNA polymerase sigma factor [Planctomycetia bacterium]|nr:sigma-70 family RNA polymerase sigma factor [Planctomycetia bacterium]